jgi:hypothetical protein
MQQSETPWNENNERPVEEVGNCNHYMTEQTITQKIRILIGSCHTILGIDLMMQHVCQYTALEMLSKNNVMTK